MNGGPKEKILLSENVIFVHLNHHFMHLNHAQTSKRFDMHRWQPGDMAMQHCWRFNADCCWLTVGYCLTYNLHVNVCRAMQHFQIL